MSQVLFGDMYGAMLFERARQEKLCAQGKFPWTCADPNVSNSQRLAVLAEEIGEVATALLANERDYAHECVQVAAVCRAWVEALLRLHSLGQPGERDIRSRFENHLLFVQSILPFTEVMAHQVQLFGHIARRVCEEQINPIAFSPPAMVGELLDLLSFSLAWSAVDLP